MNTIADDNPSEEVHTPLLRLVGRVLIDPARSSEPGWVEVENGRIQRVEAGGLPAGIRADAGDAETLITPGFIDAHIHLPQIDSIGCDGLPLLEWLDQVIFPAEARWVDERHTAAHIRTAYMRMLRAGTLGYAGYLTSHFHGLVELMRAAHGVPLRAIAGQVLMDRHGPGSLIRHELARLAVSARGRAAASVNPRFAISCSDDLLALAGRRAALHRNGPAFIQTHLAESLPECEEVRRLFPNDPHYTGVYDRHGLLTPRTLLAHCVHLSEDEWQLIAERKSVVVHCPGANVFLRSGLFDLNAAREHGVRLALGSDVAAGPDIAMPCVARALIETAKSRALLSGKRAHVPSPAEAWTMITRGNADALEWSDSGRLEVGASADLLLLKPECEFDQYLIGRLLYTWRDEYITHRILRGVLQR